MISFKQMLKESPQIIQRAFINFIERSEQNKREVISLLKQDERVILSHNGIDVYQMRIVGGMRLVGILSDKIVYVVEYTNMSNVPTIQTKLWRDKTIPESKGLPTKVVFEHIIPKYKCLFTDKEQTNDAKIFWKGILREAARRGLDIGYLNVSSDDYDIKDSKTSFEHWYKVNEGKIWGTTQEYQDVYALISVKNYYKS